ncbi:hypothetical protein FQZ97_608190 [compost metagenome]
MVVKLLLEVIDLAVCPQPVGRRTETLHPLHQHAAVPGTVEDSEAAAPRHVSPETPEVGLRALFFGRRGDRHYVVLPRVQRPSDTADGATLAGGVVAFEHHHQRMAAHALVAHQAVEPRLLGGQLLLVLVLVELEAEIEAVQQATVVQAGDQGRRVRLQARPVLDLERRLQTFEEDAANGQAAIALVRALDHIPRRVVTAGTAQHPLAIVHEVVVDLALLPVQRVELPAAPRVLLQALEAFLELLLGEVEPEFEEQGALLAKHPLEALHRGYRLLQLGVLDITLDPGVEHLAVPVAEEDADLSLRRQPAPETPLRRPRQLLVRGAQEAFDIDQPRVHPLVEQLDRLALAGTLDAVDQDEHREARLLLQFELRLQQVLAQFQHGLFIGFLVD